MNSNHSMFIEVKSCDAVVNDMQKLVLILFLPLVLVILLLDHLCPGACLVRSVKLIILIFLFSLALFIRKKNGFDYGEKKLLRLAFFLVVLGDFLFVTSLHISPLQEKTIFVGIISFLAAYACLIIAFQKSRSPGIAHAVAALPVLALFVPVLIHYTPWVSGPTFYGALLFGVVLSGMAWRAICTIIEGYYALHVALWLALAGYLMFISDLAVGLAVLNPVFSGIFVPWLQNIIWSSFIGAWIIIVLVLAEKDFLKPY